MFIRSRSSRRRVAFTLVEIFVALAILVSVAIPMFATFLFVLRGHATATNQSVIRTSTDKVVNQLTTDIRNTSRGRYNEIVEDRLKTTGTGYELTLLDSVQGQRIVWVYTNATGRFQRTTTRFNGTATPTVSMNEYDTIFTDLRMTETLRSDNPTEVGGAATGTITGIRLWGRTMLTLAPYHTTFKEVDGNGDGAYRHDEVGAALFDLDDEGDDPRWQYIFNVQPTFRNT